MSQIDGGQEIFSAMLFGFALAGVLIVAALFQDQLIAVARWFVGAAATAARPVAVRFSAAVRRIRRRARAVAPLSIQPRSSVAPRSRPAAWPAAVEPAATVDDASAAEFRTGGQSSEPEAQGDLFAPPAPTANASPTDESNASSLEPIGRRPQYTPASSIHVEASVAEFLSTRGGVVPIDRLVRHLDREFGAGLGIGLIEALRRRGYLVLRRRPESPTDLEVELADRASRHDRAAAT